MSRLFSIIRLQFNENHASLTSSVLNSPSGRYTELTLLPQYSDKVEFTVSSKRQETFPKAPADACSHLLNINQDYSFNQSQW